MRTEKGTCICLAIFLFCCSAYFLFLTSIAIGNSNADGRTELYFIVPMIALVVAANIYAAMATVKGRSRFHGALITFVGNFAFTLPLGHAMSNAAFVLSAFIFFGCILYRGYSLGLLTQPA